MKTTFLKSIQFFFFFCFSLFYSQIKISGKVEFRNKGIKDVNVTLKNTYDGATTDEKGNFRQPVSRFEVGGGAAGAVDLGGDEPHRGAGDGTAAETARL